MRSATAIATLLGLVCAGDLRAGSKTRIVAIGDAAPGGGQFLGPSLTGTPASGGNGWVAFRTLVTSGGTSEQIVAKNMVPGAVTSGATTYVVAEIGKAAGKADDKDLGTFKQFLGRPAINANGDVAFVATLSNSDRLSPDPDDPFQPIPAGVFLYRRSVPAREPNLSVVALSRDVFPGVGRLDLGTSINIFEGSFTAVDVTERTPAVNDAGDVAFAAATAEYRSKERPGDNGPGIAAMFLAPQGRNATPVVRAGDAVPGGTLQVLGPPALNNGRQIVFRALRDDLGDGVYRHAGGVTTPLVVTGRKVITPEPIPLLQDLFDFGEVVSTNDRGDVVFTAGPLFDASFDSNDFDGAPGVFVLAGDTLNVVGYPGQPIPARGRVTDITLGPDGGNDVAPPALAADGLVVFFAELNAGRQQALFRVAPPYDTTVLLPWVVLGGLDPDPSPIQGTYLAASSAPVADAAGNATFFARVAGTATAEALLFLARGGGAQSVVVGQATPTKGLFGGPPFSSVILTDQGDVYFKSFVAAGPSGLGLFHWRPSPASDPDVSLVVRTGDAVPLAGAPRIADLIGEPSINANGDVAFAALVDGLGRAVFARTAQGIRKIAIPGEEIPTPPAPAGSGFRSIAPGPLMLADGSVVFRGTYDYPDPLLPFEFLIEDGVFLSEPSGALRLLAHSRQPSPIDMPFLRFRDASGAGTSTIAFRSSLGDEFDLEPPLGLFVIDPSTAIRAVAVQGRPLSNGAVVSTFSGRPSIDANGNVAFLAGVTHGTRDGVAVIRSGVDGSVGVLAQVGADGPRGGRIKGLSRPTMSSNGHVAFRTSFEPFTGGTPGFFLSTESGTAPMMLIGESDAHGEGGKLTSLNPSASLNANDRLAFIGTSNTGTARNGIFLGTAATLTARSVRGRVKEATLAGKPRDTLRGQLTLSISGDAGGFNLGRDAVAVTVVDRLTSYFSTTITANKLAQDGGAWKLKRRQGAIRKLRVRARRGSVRVTFTAGGLDLFLFTPPLTVRLDVGNHSGTVTVPCQATPERVTCSSS